MRQANKIRRSQVRDCEAAALDPLKSGEAEAILRTKSALEKARVACTKCQQQLRQKEAVVSVGETQELIRMTKNKYFEMRINACTLKQRLCDLLQARKFERD